jgi:hypothetical protein
MMVRGRSVCRIVSLTVVVFGFFMINSVGATELQIANETFIASDPPAAVIDPHNITKSDDGDYIVTGRIAARQQAWASKIDISGGVKWQYVMGLEESLPIGKGAEFNGAIQMQDGSIFLCGNMPRPPGVYAPAVLIQIAADGHTEKKQYIAPQGRTDRGIVTVRNCARWGQDIVILSSVLHIIEPTLNASPPVVDQFYWLLRLDASGRKKWELRIPTTLGAITDRGSLIITSGSDLIFSSWELDQTELFRVGDGGSLSASQKMPGQFRLVQGTSRGNSVKLFGYTEDGLSASVTLDKDLHEVVKIKGALSIHQFVSSGGFETPGKLVLLFGSALHQVGETYSTRMLLLDDNLRSLGSLELSERGSHDNGRLVAFSPTSNENEFLVARSLLRRGEGVKESSGAAIDLVRIK